MDITAEKCRAAAEVLRAAAERMKDRQRFEICAQCLDLMASSDWRLDGDKMLTGTFVQEAGSLLEDIVASAGQQDNDIDALCFTITECLAVIFRERVLCRPDGQARDIEARLFEYFENSKDWSPNDGNLVTYFYYTKLPSSLASARAGTL